jgi:ABC-2 type transport system permease protein
MTIAGREWRAYFLSTSGWVVVALFALLTAIAFIFLGSGLANGQIASMRSVFAFSTWILAFIAPAITMRLLSEEFRLRTYETLVTAPVRATDIIVGKYLGAMGLLVAMLLPTLIYVALLEQYGRPDYGELACGYLGLIVAGSAYIASGVLVSTLTASQPVAFLVTLFFWMTISLAAKWLPNYVGDDLARAFYAADPEMRLRDFTIGLIDTSNVVYFLGLTVFFLMAAVQSLLARRWPS